MALFKGKTTFGSFTCLTLTYFFPGPSQRPFATQLGRADWKWKDPHHGGVSFGLGDLRTLTG